MDLQNPEPEDFLCDESFLRYCNGEEQADIIWWENWLKAHPDKSIVVSKAKRLFDTLNAGQGNRMDQLASLKDAIARRERFKEDVLKRPEILLPKPGRIVKFNRRSFIGYAATIAVLITTGTLAYLKYGGKNAWVPHNYEYYTSEDSHKTIMLPDSSVIMLNENSHLSISKNFDARHREVTISGEAFFDIKQDAEHPFIVHTNEYRIRVLGTSFNVRSYPGSKITETDLITGKVEIVTNAGGRGTEKVILKPHQKFILEQETIADIKSGSSAVPAKKIIATLNMDTLTRHVTETSWARRKMEVHDETFDQIAQKLESWYGIKIIFANEAVKKYRYTATFDDETIFKVLQYLQQSYPFTYKIEQDSIVITQG